MVDVKVEPKRIAFWLTVDTDSYNFDPSLQENEIRRQTCANPDLLRGIRDGGVSIEYHYADEHKHFLSSIAVTKCP